MQSIYFAVWAILPVCDSALFKKADGRHLELVNFNSLSRDYSQNQEVAFAYQISAPSLMNRGCDIEN